MGKKEFKHLSKSVKPLNYKIQLQPDLELHNFKGEELVDIEVSLCLIILPAVELC